MSAGPVDYKNTTIDIAFSDTEIVSTSAYQMAVVYYYNPSLGPCKYAHVAGLNTNSYTLSVQQALNELNPGASNQGFFNVMAIDKEGNMRYRGYTVD